jgi:DNA polymerase phi
LLLAKVVATGPSEYLKSIFTRNTILQLVNHLKTDERYLHRSASKTMQVLLSRAKRDPSIVSYTIQGLVLEASGMYNFDSVTKTKTVAKLLSAADLSALQVLVPAVRDAIEHPQTIDEKQVNSERRVFCDILVSACARVFAMVNGDSDNSASVVNMIVDTLIGLAYSNKPLASDGRTFEPLPSSECREYLRSRLRTCLDQSSQHRAMKSDLLRHTSQSLKAVHEQVDGDHVIVEFDEQTEDIVKTVWKRLRKISKTVSRRRWSVANLDAKAHSRHLGQRSHPMEQNPQNFSKCFTAWPCYSSTTEILTRLEYCKILTLTNTTCVENPPSPITQKKPIQCSKFC